MNELLAGDLRQGELMPLALLLHDTGKPLTRTQELEDGRVRIRFLEHEQESAKIGRKVMQRLRFSLQATDFVEAIVANHMRPLLLSAEKKLSRKAIYRLFRATSGSKYQAGVAVALHALADQRATYPPGQGQAEEQVLLKVIVKLVEAYFEQREQVVDPPLLLTGRDLIQMGVPQGRLVGVLLNRLREAQAAGLVQNKQAALVFIKSDPDFGSSQTAEL
jgi:poly(A) polymerase